MFLLLKARIVIIKLLGRTRRIRHADSNVNLLLSCDVHRCEPARDMAGSIDIK
jgi:hypothetical protein